MLVALCRHFDAERQFYQNALQVEGQNSFREYFCGMVKPVLVFISNNMVEEENEKKDFYIGLFSEGLLEELMYWLREGNGIGPDEFAQDLHRISLGLARRVLAEQEAVGMQETLETEWENRRDEDRI